MEAIV
jgi:hypothetical protein